MTYFDYVAIAIVGASGSGKSRPQFTPVMWKSTSLAPQIQSAITATSRSVTSLTGFLERTA